MLRIRAERAVQAPRAPLVRKAARLAARPMRDLAGAWLLLVVLVTLGSTGVGTMAAQDEVRTSIGTLSDTQNVTARFVAIIAANGRAVLYLVSDNPDWNWRYSRWFASRADGIRLFARSNDGTEATAFLWGNRLVGTLGTIGWSGTLSGRQTGGLYQSRVGDEIHLVLVAPDNASIGTTWSTAGQLVRTWDTGAGSVERLSDAVIRARPDGGSEYLELNRIAPDSSGAWANAPWVQ